MSSESQGHQRVNVIRESRSSESQGHQRVKVGVLCVSDQCWSKSLTGVVLVDVAVAGFAPNWRRIILGLPPT